MEEQFRLHLAPTALEQAPFPQRLPALHLAEQDLWISCFVHDQDQDHDQDHNQDGHLL